MKHKTSDKNVRREVLKDVAYTAPKIKAVVIDKSVSKTSGKYLYHETTKELLDDVFKDRSVKNSKGISVIFHNHTALPGKTANEVVMKMAKERKIKLNKPTTSMDLKEAPILSIHDFPTGAVGERYERGNKKEHETIQLKTKVRKIFQRNGKK